MTSTPQPTATSCADDYDPASLTCEKASARIAAAISPIGGHERVALRDALGRVLAEDVHAIVDVPAHANSAVDGYALRAADLAAPQPQPLKLVGTATAGHPWTGRLQPGECVRIMTGAVLPAGADAVVMQERVRREEDAVYADPVPPGENVRAAGEDLRAGSLVLAAGRRLTPADLGLVASQGRGELTVRRRLRVAFFSTGDELRTIGEPLGPGELYDSNRYTLHAMLGRFGAERLDLGVVRDSRAELESALASAAANADVVITSGGVSVGEADYVKETLATLGSVAFWKVALKPGRPLAFGRIGSAWFFGLPGNPVSVMVTYYQFVEPALRRLQGETLTEPLLIRARALSSFRKRPGRTEFQRGVLSRDAQGQLVVEKTGDQGSGILSSMSRANCFVVLGMDVATVEAGMMVDVQPFAGLI